MCCRIQRTRLKREVEQPREAVTPPIPSQSMTGTPFDFKPLRPESRLKLPFQTATIFKKVASALNLPPTFVSALDHASGLAEVSRVVGKSGTNECIG